MPRSEHRGAVLTIDLDAIAANYRLLVQRLQGRACAAVVKANAYGLGVERVAPTLAAAGARTFFVAHLDEGIALRALLPEVEIVVLSGPIAGAEADYVRHRLLPTLNHLGDIAAWRRFAAVQTGCRAALHLDTGMARLGLSRREVELVAAEPKLLDGVSVAWILSHLACADEPDHPLNRKQLGELRALLPRLPCRAPVSFANSSGIFLGADYHFDLGRPGVALYGVNPTPGRPNPMRPVVRLQAPILQLRDVDRPGSVGYGAAQAIEPPAKLATVGVGYADGYFRSSSPRARAVVGDVHVPIVGRVSMDLTVLDVSDAPLHAVQPGCMIDLIGPGHTVDEMADEAGTIGYEVLTALGSRYRRNYVGGAAAPG